MKFLFQKITTHLIRGEDNFLDRLSSLGKNPWSWFSWYAVQRKEILQITIEEALNFKIDGFLFEKFVSFCHSALYKTKKLDYFLLVGKII